MDRLSNLLKRYTAATNSNLASVVADNASAPQKPSTNQNPSTATTSQQAATQTALQTTQTTSHASSQPQVANSRTEKTKIEALVQQVTAKVSHLQPVDTQL